MNLTRELSATLLSDGHVVVAGKKMPFQKGDPVVVVGFSDNKNHGLMLVCVAANGAIFNSLASNVKIMVDKDLRERLAEATLTDSGGGGR